MPHDPLINQTFVPSAGEGAAFLPRRVVWYRKSFALPASFRGRHIGLYAAQTRHRNAVRRLWSDGRLIPGRWWSRTADHI